MFHKRYILRTGDSISKMNKEDELLTEFMDIPESLTLISKNK